MALLAFFGVYSLMAQSNAPFVMVLGIAQDAGFPQANCQKPCCEKVWSGEMPGAKVSCIGLIDPIDSSFWLFDATPDFPEQLQMLLPYGQLNGIFLTHAHIGHYTGLMYLGREVIGADELPVYAMPRMHHFLQENGPWSQLLTLNNIALKELVANEPVFLNERLSVKPLIVPHRDEFSETVGFILSSQDASLLFIPDIDKWQVWDKDIKALVQEVDFALLDGTFFQNGEIPGRDMSEIPHPFIAESMQLLDDLPQAEKQKVHFIHFNHTNPVLQPDSEARQLVKSRGFHLTEEGMQLPLSHKK